LKECAPKAIFKADETGFFHRCMPDKTFKGEQSSGGTKSKEKVTVMTGCNADGSESFPCL
jgi:hypothetical protein